MNQATPPQEPKPKRRRRPRFRAGRIYWTDDNRGDRDGKGCFSKSATMFALTLLSAVAAGLLVAHYV